MFPETGGRYGVLVIDINGLTVYVTGTNICLLFWDSITCGSCGYLYCVFLQ